MPTPSIINSNLETQSITFEGNMENNSEILSIGLNFENSDVNITNLFLFTSTMLINTTRL